MHCHKRSLEIYLLPSHAQVEQYAFFSNTFFDLGVLLISFPVTSPKQIYRLSIPIHISFLLLDSVYEFFFKKLKKIARKPELQLLANE